MSELSTHKKQDEASMIRFHDDEDGIDQQEGEDQTVVGGNNDNNGQDVIERSVTQPNRDEHEEHHDEIVPALRTPIATPPQQSNRRQPRSPFLRSGSLIVRSNGNHVAGVVASSNAASVRPHTPTQPSRASSTFVASSHNRTNGLMTPPHHLSKPPSVSESNAMTWPRKRTSTYSNGAEQQLIEPPRRVMTTVAAGDGSALPLPIANVTQERVHLTWRMASQTIALRLQEEERTARAISSMYGHGRTGSSSAAAQPLMSLFQPLSAPTTTTSTTSSAVVSPHEIELVQRVLAFDVADETKLGSKDISDQSEPLNAHLKHTSSHAYHPASTVPSTATSPNPLAAPVVAPVLPGAKREMLDADWHRLPLDEICASLECDADRGLRESDLPARRLKYGQNILSTTGNKYAKLAWMFAKQLVAGFGTILWVCALLAFLAWKPFGDPADPTNLGLGIVLIVVVVLQATFNFYQEYQSNAIMDSFRSLLPSYATVIRRINVSQSPSSDIFAAGDEQEVSVEKEVEASELLVGDLVKLSMGGKIPADIRLVEVAELKVNNSALTGEMEAIACTSHATSQNFLESNNVVFFGSMAVEGSAIGIVVAVGDQTALGKICQLSNSEEQETLSLHKEINRFVYFIVVAAVITAVVSFVGWLAWLRVDYPDFMPLANIVVNIIGLVVAYVPTGLPISVTLTLTMVAKRMYGQQVLVKNLATVETFNSVTVIATDKTGTLTQNVMSVANIYWGLKSGVSSSTASRGVGIHAKDSRSAVEYETYRILIQGAQLCNNATLRTTSTVDEAMDKRIPQAASTTALNAAVQAHVEELQTLAASGAGLEGDQALMSILAGSSAVNSCFIDLDSGSSSLNGGQSTYSIVGDAADTAFYTFCTTHLGLNVEMTRAMYEREKVLPFNSKNKYMISIHQAWSGVAKRMEEERVLKQKQAVGTSSNLPVASMPPLNAGPSSIYPPLVNARESTHVVWMKGACEIILSRCTTYLNDASQEEVLTPTLRLAILARMESLGRLGERVLGFARLDVDMEEWNTSQCENQEDVAAASSSSSSATASSSRDVAEPNQPRGFPSKDLCFVGMISLIDPPRANVASSVLRCRRAGIQVAMVTGDHPTTSVAIARKVNILLKHSTHELLHTPVKEIARFGASGERNVHEQGKKVNVNNPNPNQNGSNTLSSHHLAINNNTLTPHKQGAHHTLQGSPTVDRTQTFGADSASTDIAQDSLDITTDPETGRCIVVMLRDGTEIARHVPTFPSEQSTQPNSPTNNATDAANASGDAATLKARALARSRLKDVVQNPVPPLNRVIVEQFGLGGSSQDSIKNGHAVPSVVRAGWTSADAFDSISPLPYSLVLTGSQLRVLDDSLWDWIMRHTEGLVFARTSPEQKLRIVIEYQKRGHIVAVTGDGVNDAPALKKADLGVAMQAGAEVAREAAALILLDNNFSSVVTAIEMGRTVFDNLKKVTLYLLPAGSFSEMLPVIANVFLGVPLPLSPFLMIVICILTDLFPSLALVNEQPEEEIMGRMPRDVNGAHLVDVRLVMFAYFNIGMIESISAFLLYFSYISAQGIPASGVWLAFDKWTDGYYGFSQAELNEMQFTGQSIFFLSLVITQFGNLLSSRTRRMSFFTQNPFYGGQSRNMHIIYAIITSTIIAVLITQIRWFNDTFNTRPVGAVYIAPAIGFAGCIFVYDELRKWWIRTHPNSWVAKVAW